MSQAPAAISPHTSTRVQARRRLGATGLALALVSTVTLWAAPAYAAVPDAPTITSVTAGDKSLTVAFTAGAENGSAITTYKYKLDGGTATTRLTGTTESPLVITGLANNTPYSVTIIAVSIDGDSAESNALSGTTNNVPSAPTITGITAGDKSLSVAFTPGADGGSSITTYKYILDSGTATVRATGTTASPLVITGLTNGTSYSVTILAVNANGDSAASNAISQTTNDVPSAPTITGITAGDKSLSVAFTPGADGGSSITTYKYILDSGTATVRATGTTASPLVITGLTNGTSYSVTILAVNANGDSAASNAISQTTNDVPSAPTITGISEGDGSLTVAFTAGADGGSSITTYKYILDSGTATVRATGTTASPLVITGLTNGTSYSVKILAVNANGDSAASNAVSGTPTAPCTLTTLGDIRFGDGSAKLSATQKAKLRVYAHRIADAGCTAITLNGHTSGLGNSTTLERIRTKITKARNAAVKKYLKAQLAKLEVTVTYTTHVYNAQRPKYPLNGPNAAKNRRVEIVMGPGAS